ncbi:TPA: hypothetical protein R1801_000277 [Campylobacter jejuni]|nr:hypothetical protein [Campylobacter jejuni]
MFISYGFCKYAEDQREDRAVPIATLIRLGMGYGISYANAPDVGGQTYTKDSLLGDVIDS